MIYFLVTLFAPPLFILLVGGLTIETISLSITYILCISGFFAFKGGSKQSGIIAIVIGLVIGFLGANWHNF